MEELTALLADRSKLPWTERLGLASQLTEQQLNLGEDMPRASLLIGQSGAGKSSILNTLTGLNIRTQELSRSRGVHTTTATELIHLESGGSVFDSPGIAVFQPPVVTSAP